MDVHAKLGQTWSTLEYIYPIDKDTYPINKDV